jgi:cobalt/nickel transport system permease protein
MLVLVEGYDGFVKAEIYTGRLLYVAMILSFIMYQTTNESLLKVLHQLKIPSIFIELAFFTLRFTDVFKVEIRNMHLSIRSKGFQTVNFFNVKTIKILGHLLGSMLVRSLQRSERIYLGMQSRGYNGQILHIENEKLPKIEWVCGALLIFILIFIQFLSKEAF